MAKRKGGKRRKKVHLAPEHKSKRATSARQIITHTKVSGGKGAMGTRMARVEKKVDALGVVVHEHDQELDAQRTFLASIGNTVNRALGGGGAAANPEENPYRGQLGSGKKKGKKRHKKSKKAKKSGSAPKKRHHSKKRRSGGKRRASHKRVSHKKGKRRHSKRSGRKSHRKGHKKGKRRSSKRRKH